MASSYTIENNTQEINIKISNPPTSVELTKEQYEALGNKDADTYYFVEVV